MNIEKLLNDLEEYRLENKLSYEALALELGIAYSTLHRYLNRKNVRPTKINLYHINKFLIKKAH